MAKNLTGKLLKCSKAIKILIFSLFLIIIFGVLLNFSSRESIGYELVESILNFNPDNINLIKILSLIALLSLILTISSLYIAKIFSINCAHMVIALTLTLLVLISLGYFEKIKTAINTYTFIHSQQQKYVEKNPKSLCDNTRFIAHAGGMINNDTYTNSLEALNLSYKNKFKLFELDILKTSDNKYVAAHDWDSWKLWSGYHGKLPPTHKDFLSYKIRNKYTPLDMKSINSWFLSHTDAILITDKVNNPKEFSNIFIDKKRLIMELFTMSSIIEGIKNNVLVMPTWDLVKLIQGNRLEVLRNLGVQFISANNDNLIYNKKVFLNFTDNGMNIYIYGSVNTSLNSKYYYGRYVDNQQSINKCLNPLLVNI